MVTPPISDSIPHAGYSGTSNARYHSPYFSPSTYPSWISTRTMPHPATFLCSTHAVHSLLHPVLFTIPGRSKHGHLHGPESVKGSGEFQSIHTFIIRRGRFAVTRMPIAWNFHPGFLCASCVRQIFHAVTKRWSMWHRIDLLSAMHLYTPSVCRKFPSLSFSLKSFYLYLRVMSMNRATNLCGKYISCSDVSHGVLLKRFSRSNSLQTRSICVTVLSKAFLAISILSFERHAATRVFRRRSIARRL